MADYPIPTQLVVDERLIPAANAQVTVYDLNDTGNTTPLNLKDMNGNPLLNPITTTANALSPNMLAPVPKVKFVAPSTGLSIPVVSTDGLEAAARAAADNANAAKQFVTSISVGGTTTGPAGDAAAVAFDPATGKFSFTIPTGAQGPQGLPGMNAAPADSAVAGYIKDGATQTKGALDAFSADPFAYGASATADSSNAFTSTLNNKGVINLKPGATYQLNAPVTLPAGTVINGNGATIKQYAQSCLILSAGCTVRDLTINAGDTVGYVGGEVGVSIRGANCKLSGVTFTGNGYRYGAMVEIPGGGGGSCDNVTIDDCDFNGTSYGILKQGGPVATPTTANYLRITNCRFKNIRRGDAIELNAGADVGVVIANNTISGVTADGVTHAGIGIGVAGLNGYGGPIGSEFRRFTIANNVITDVEYQAIHTEQANRFLITGNYCEQVSTSFVGTGYGIVTYGARDSLVATNEVIGFAHGIFDDIGAAAGAFVVSTDRTMIAANAVRDCTTRGIYVGCSGQGKSTYIERNNVNNCPVGIEQYGAANYYYTGNTVVNCATPYRGDCNPADKSAVAATNRTLAMYDNKAFKIGGTVGANAFTNTAGTTIVGANNTFTLPT